MVETKNWAVLVIDVQNDFCPGGSLAVPGGDEIVKPINFVLKEAHERGKLRIFTRDWHPRDTKHFAEFGGPWPVHCVQDTDGAKFKEGLDLEGAVIVSKGMSKEDDVYSLTGFGGRTKEGQSLDEILREAGKPQLITSGLATDYCVKATVLDGLKLGYEVTVLWDSIRAVDLKADDGRMAIKEMIEAGATMKTYDEFLESVRV